MKTQVLIALFAGAQAISHHHHHPHQRSYVKFATGMNGDEDLGEDITMKGNKFHFVEKKTRECPDDDLPTCNGTNGIMGEDCCPAGGLT